MANPILCSQCQAPHETHVPMCLVCGAALLPSGHSAELNETNMSDEEEDFRTVRMEGFTGADLANLYSGSQDALSSDALDPFMQQEDRTLVGGSGEHPSAWSGESNQVPPLGPASGAFPQAGSAFGAPPPVQPPGGYIFVEGSDSPSMTVRQEAPGFSGGRNEEMATYSGPVDISRASAEKSPIMRVVWLGLIIAVAIVSFVVIKPYIPTEPKEKKVQVVQVMLKLQTKPLGAGVWVNGKKLEGTTPTSVQSRIGERVYIQIRKKGFKSVDFTWSAKGNQQRTVELLSTTPPKPRIDPKVVALRLAQEKARKARRAATLRKRRRNYVPANHTALRVVTIPPGAKVRVQGRLQRGLSPLRVILPNGVEAKITIQKYGHHDASFVWKAGSQAVRKKVIRMYRHSWYSP